MRNINSKKLFKAFTLIELLIVVAIIAILAAIAVPNFLEAQTRSKISRVLSDMRSIRVAIESYYVDTNRYPETDTGETDMLAPGVGLYRVTTPIAYITSIPKSPFKEIELGNPGTPQNAVLNNTVLYIGARKMATDNDSDSDGINDNYEYDRMRYLYQAAAPNNVLSSPKVSEGNWGMKSVGPDNKDDFQVLGNSARLYDPTNGTVSAGDIYVWGDRPTALGVAQ